MSTCVVAAPRAAVPTPSLAASRNGPATVAWRAPVLIAALAAALLGGCASSGHDYRRGSAADPYVASHGEAAARRAAHLRTQGYYTSRPAAAHRVAAVRRARAAALKARAQRAARSEAAAVQLVKAVPAAPLPGAMQSGAMQSGAITERAMEVSAAHTELAPKGPAVAGAAASPPLPRTTTVASTGARRLVDEGRALFQAGQLIKARERFYAAMLDTKARLPDILPELARTYDPLYVERLPRADAKPNAAMARAIYQRAAASGSRSVEADLTRLGGTPETPR